MKDNMKKREMFPIWALSILLLSGSAIGQECEQGNYGYVRKRMFIGKYRGPPTPVGDEESAGRNLGKCRTTAEHAEKMLKTFEAFGIDLSPMRSKPYETYETAEFTVKTHVLHPDGNFTIILNTFYEYAQVTYSPLMFSSWSLLAKSDLNGREKSLPAGFWAIFGMMRFNDYGRDFCMGYTEWDPLVPLNPVNGVSTLRFRLENEDWGIGNFTCVQTGNNLDVYDADYIFQF